MSNEGPHTYCRRDSTARAFHMHYSYYSYEHSSGSWEFHHTWEHQAPPWVQNVLKYGSSQKDDPYFYLTQEDARTLVRPGVFLVDDPVFGIRVMAEEEFWRHFERVKR